MAYNLFIAYDLNSLGQNYEAVRDKIKSLGKWHQFQLSLFYVNTDLTPAEAYDAVWQTMDSTDRLIVINAASGVVSDWDNPPLLAINSIWHRP